MKNDDRILTLKTQIAAKKKELGKTRRFSPITSCSIELDGSRYNIHTLSKQDLVFLLVKLNAYYKSAVDLDMVDDCQISGFHICDWGADVRERLDIMQQQEKLNDLARMEKTLDKLLSDDKRTELEIDSIAALLE